MLFDQMLLDIEAFFTQPARIIGLGVLALIFVGVALRKKRRVHPPIMATCFAIDLGLVVYLEVTREAIAEAADRILETDMLIHIILATLSILLYVVLMYTGSRVLKGMEDKFQRVHRCCAYTFLVNRVLVLITAIMVSQ